jgi:ABC-type glycerol-3-phosphate transport system substrate-binding protein
MSRGSLSRRRFLYTSGILAASGALAATEPGRRLVAPAHAASTKLSFWVPPGGTAWCNTLDAVQRNYSKLHPDVQFSPVLCGTGKQDFNTVVLAHITAGNPPDAMVTWNTPVSFGVQGALVQLDDMMAHSKYSQASNWPSSVLASCQFNGKTYGLPASDGSYAFWYNQEWFEKKGIPSSRDKFPKTWDDLRKLSKEFTYWKGNQLVTAGYVPMRAADAESPPTLYSWPALNGGQIYDAQSRKYTIDSDQNVAMMEYMVSWLNEEYKGDIVAVERSGNWQFSADAQNRPGAFCAGKMAMSVEGSWNIGDIYNQPLAFTRWEVAPFPVGPGGTKTTSATWPDWLVIPHGSHNVDAAFAWIDYLGSVGMRTWFTSVPDLPANKTVPTNIVPPVVAKKRGQAFAVDVVNFFRHQAAISTPMWNSPVEAYATDQLVKAVSKIMYKSSKPKDALATAQQACQSQLQRTLLTAR